MSPATVPTAAPPLAPAAAADALRRAGVPVVSLLESGLDLDGLGRWSFLCGRPSVVATAEPGGPLRAVVGGSRCPALASEDPLAGAAELLALLRPPGWEPDPEVPFAGGALLTLAFDLGRRWERWGERARADVAWPDLHLAVHPGCLAFDHARGAVRAAGACGLSPSELDVARAAGQGEDAVAAARSDELARGEESLDTGAYRAAVQAARRYIRAGDLFEVNVTRRHALSGVDPSRLYSALRAAAPAPFMADLELGDGRRLLSASPERFLSLEPGGRIGSWPIKGTRPRGGDPAEDAALAAELLASDKDAAELAMIVDLVRNDLGRVARPGSVRVDDARRLQRWPTVHHTVAIVSAELDAGLGWADVVAAAFPPGSVTGAPKLRALQVIDELEPVRRGLYCGAFGYVGWDGRLELAVAIRIVALAHERAFVHAGGAVLLDSSPADEEREARAKAAAILRAAAAAGGAAAEEARGG